MTLRVESGSTLFVYIQLQGDAHLGHGVLLAKPRPRIIAVSSCAHAWSFAVVMQCQSIVNPSTSQNQLCIDQAF